MAGNALASPAINGKPLSANTRQAPMASPAAIPRIERIINGTLLLPPGASLFFILNKKASIAKATKPVMANCNSLTRPSVAFLAIIKPHQARIAQVDNEAIIVSGSLSFSCLI